MKFRFNNLFMIPAEHQKRIRPNLHPTYNEPHEKIIGLKDSPPSTKICSS